jgi:hypothetical protein
VKRSDVFPSKWLNPSDLGGDMVVMIREVKLDEIGRENEPKPIVFFEGNLKPMILNVTNWKSLEKLFGMDSDGWGGKQITLFVKDDIEAFGEIVSGIRIRPELPTSPAVPDQVVEAGPGPPDPVEPLEEDFPF